MNKLKVLVAMVLFLSLPTLTIAEEKNQDDINYSICKVSASFAEGVMQERQEGTPMDSVVERMRNSDTWEKTHPLLRKILMSTIVLAYTIPRYQHEEDQRKAIEDFRNDCYRICIEETISHE